MERRNMRRLSLVVRSKSNMKIRELFDQCAMAYDQDRPKLVPCFDEFYGAAMRMIPFPADANLHVLDSPSDGANLRLQADKPPV
jgi:hypothetical protein